MYEKFLLEEIVKIRRELHMFPEKGLCEYKTSEYIEKYLKDLNIDVLTGVGGTGVIGIIKGQSSARAVAVRADMDCLEVTEDTGVEFSSRTPGLMHACGHDGHMAAVLGLASHIRQSGVKYDNDVVLIFQPAEEGPGGAKLIVDSGVLNKFNIKAILSMHIFPEVKEGYIGTCSGPLTARNGEIDIQVIGKSGHGALPHTGIDSIVAASQIIGAVQTILTRRIDPRDNAVITFGKMYGGEVRNIIAGKVTLEGTIRAFSKEVYSTIKKSIIDICRGTEVANGCSVKVDIRDMYPEVYNDEALFDLFLKVCSGLNIERMKPLMIAEDFAYYREVAPEFMFMLGSRNEEKGYTHSLHNCRFNFDEGILLTAVSVFNDMIKALDQE